MNSTTLSKAIPALLLLIAATFLALLYAFFAMKQAASELRQVGDETAA